MCLNITLLVNPFKLKQEILIASECHLETNEVLAVRLSLSKPNVSKTDRVHDI